MKLRHLAVVAVAATTAAAAQQPFELDAGFKITAIQSQAIGDILERPDGKIIISGWMYDPVATSYRLGNLLNSDGSLVPRPPDQGFWYALLGGKMVPYEPDRFYVGNGQGLRRYWTDGAWDTTFNDVQQPLYMVQQGGDFHVFSDGRVLMTGNHRLMDTARGFVGQGYGLIWLNNDGSLDTTRIHRYIGSGSTITRIRALADGRFICGGRLLQYEGEPVPSIVYRVLPDGAMDTTFHGPVTTYGYVDYFLEQPDGKVLMTGNFCFEGSPDTLGLVRLLPDGQLDPAFNNTQQFRATYRHGQIVGTRQVRAIEDAMLAVTGDFDRIDGEVHGGIAMLDIAGNPLPEYFEGSGCGAYQFGDPTIWPYPQKLIVGIKPAQDGGYFIYGAYHGYDDGTTNDGSQRLMSKLYGLNVGIQEQAANAEPLQIAPNPANEAVQFSFGTAPTVNAILTIHDASGRMVLEEPWPAGAYTHTLQAGALAPGSYLVRLAGAQGTTTTGKLIILP